MMGNNEFYELLGILLDRERIAYERMEDEWDDEDEEWNDVYGDGEEDGEDGW